LSKFLSAPALKEQPYISPCRLTKPARFVILGGKNFNDYFNSVHFCPDAGDSMIASRDYFSSLLTILGTLVLALSYASTALGVYNPQANPSAQDWWYADGVLVVNFKTEASKSAFKLGKSGVKTGLPHVDQMFSKYQVGGFDQMFVGSQAPKSSKDVDLTNYYRITFSNKASLDEAVADFASLTEVEHVEKVSVHPVMVVPNDPSFSSQWALKQTNDQDIDADIAWDTESGDSSILVSAMDTGVQ
jgi:hypothetical protein